MNEVLKTAVSLSLSGSLLILLLLLCKPLYRNRLSKRWQYYVWLVAVARLLLPFTPEVSLMGLLFRQTEQAVIQTEDDVPPPGGASASVPPVQGGTQPVNDRTEPEAEPERLPPEALGAAAEHLWAVWLGVALVLLIRKITVYQSFVQYIRAGRQEISDVARLDRLAQIGEQMGVKRPVELCVVPMVSSPLLLGFFRPCIVLPSAELPEADFTYTVRHELTHYKRRDMFYKWLVQLAVCLHWFNPLVWLMCREVGRACELSCDEAVIGELSPAERRAYGDTLLRAIGAGGNYKSSLASVTLNESAKLLKERLGAIMKFQKSQKLLTALSVVLAALLLAGAAGAGAYIGAGAAGKRTETPTELKGNGEAGFYTRNGYYQAPYLFEIAWNIRENADYTAKALSLPDGTSMTVYFADPCTSGMKDGDTLVALSEVLGRLKSEAESTPFPLVCPLVVGIRKTGDASPASLAEQYYKEGALPQFGAVFALMEEDEQETLLMQICDDGNVAFFSVGVKELEPDSPLVERLAETMYEDRNVALFSVLVNNCMDRETLQRWAVRASEDGYLAARSILQSALENDEDLKALNADLEALEAELEAMKAEQDARLLREYEAYGITKTGVFYTYQGQKVRVLLDTRANSSVVTLASDPDGEVGVHIFRDESGTIQRVERMTEEEMTELFEDMAEPDDWDDWFDFPEDDGDIVRIPVELDTLKNGEVVWLGEYKLSEGDRFRYDVSADYSTPRTGKGIEIGFAKSEDEPIEVRYFAVTSDRCVANLVFSSPYVGPGRYHLFIRAAGTDLENVTGSITLVLQAEQG